MTDTIRFFGVRGSIATPGPETTATGGNTSCIDLSLGEERIILDAGTGLRLLGTEMAGQPLRATILFSHLHWDHIQGIPFFSPLYHPKSQITLVGPPGLKDALTRQMSRPTFPVGMEIMGAAITFREVAPGDTFAVGAVTISCSALNHPGGAIGYRLEHAGRVVSYACDTEHPAQGLDPNVIALARKADLLIYDAQYLPDEYPSRVGWGHSTFEKGAEVARAAGAKKLVLTHHEPARTDAQIAEVEARARALFPDSWAAREGLVFLLDGEEPALPLDRLLEATLATALATG